MKKTERGAGSAKDPNRYIVYEGPDAETWQFWEDEWHNHHDDMNQEGHKACPDCGHDLKDWPG